MENSSANEPPLNEATLAAEKILGEEQALKEELNKEMLQLAADAKQLKTKFTQINPDTDLADYIEALEVFRPPIPYKTADALEDELRNMLHLRIRGKESLIQKPVQAYRIIETYPEELARPLLRYIDHLNTYEPMVATMSIDEIKMAGYAEIKCEQYSAIHNDLQQRTIADMKDEAFTALVRIEGLRDYTEKAAKTIIRIGCLRAESEWWEECALEIPKDLRESNAKGCGTLASIFTADIKELYPKQKELISGLIFATLVIHGSTLRSCIDEAD